MFPLVTTGWSEPEPAALAWSWTDADDDPSLSGDMLELFFNQGSVIARSTRGTTAESWRPPAVVDELGLGEALDTTPEILPDGLTMYLASDRGTGMQGAYDVFVAARGLRDEPWGIPTRVLPLITVASDTSPSADADNLSIVITSDVPGDFDLYLSERSSTTEQWPTPVPITAVNSGADEQAAFLSADGLALYFVSTRNGSADLFIAQRASKRALFGEPELLAGLNSEAEDADPWVSPDGTEIYFISNRTGRFELWHATR